MADRRARSRCGLAALLLVVALLLGAGCRVEHVLTPSLPSVAGSLGPGEGVVQAFSSASDGLNRVVLGIDPPTHGDAAAPPSLGGGASVLLRYAPEADPRFPEPAFHDWPADEAWLPELTGSIVIGQSLLSPYPGLSGITLRVATFGADAGQGEGQIAAGASAPVLALPIDGALVATLAPGSSVQVQGAAEGWAAVELPGDQRGFVDLARFAHLPAPERVNDQDVTLTLYREPELSEVRRVTLNAREMHDNAHVTFAFAPLPDSLGARYRFTLTSPGSRPGDAVAFRYAPASGYAGGRRYDGEQTAPGALIFKPVYDAGAPLWEGALDDFVWSGQTQSLDHAFAPLADTADRYLAVEIRPGSGPLSLHWSRLRPPGGVPLRVIGDPTAPSGGLVFNVGYRSPLAGAAIVRQSGDALLRDARADLGFFVIYALAMLGVLGWCGWIAIRWAARGR